MTSPSCQLCACDDFHFFLGCQLEHFNNSYKSCFLQIYLLNQPVLLVHCYLLSLINLFWLQLVKALSPWFHLSECCIFRLCDLTLFKVSSRSHLFALLICPRFIHNQLIDLFEVVLLLLFFLIGLQLLVIEPVLHIDLIPTLSNIDHTCLDQSGLQLLVCH